MNVEAERETFEVIIRPLADAAKERLRAEFAELAEQHAAAAAADQPAIETKIMALQKAAAIAAHEAPSGVGRLYLVIGGVIILSFVTLWLYFGGIGPEQYVLIETTRPVLVFTLIIAMLGFGGALIFTPLFTRERHEDFHPRFRLAREIFLVYSGIFGTIIGFYFGAASEGGTDGAKAPAAEIAFAYGRVTATVTEGDEPFMGIFTAPGETGGTAMTVDDRVLTFAPPGGMCPEGATVLVVDGRGRRAEGTVDCDGGDVPPDNAATENGGSGGQGTGPADNAAEPANGAEPAE